VSRGTSWAGSCEIQRCPESYSCKADLSSRRAPPQESRKSGSAIGVRGKFGVPGLSSEGVSYLRLFSSDGTLRRSALAGSVDV